MKDLFSFYYSIMQNGKNKGAVNTFRKKYKFIFRNLLYFKYSKRIGNFLINHPYLKKEVYRYPCLCSKIHRPYIQNDFSIDDKVKIISSSYDFLDKFFNKNILEALYKTGSLKLCDIFGKNEKKYSLFFNLYTNFEKEGEFNLICENSDKKILAKLTFSIWENKILIGGLQGLEKNENQELLKEATKDLYGLFPKKLVIEALYFLFPKLDKVAVGNNKHIYLSLRYKFKKQRTIHANYDEFWESLGGVLKNDVWLLPNIIERKDISEIPSKKRSMYNNRYILLDNLEKKLSKLEKHL